MTITLTDEQAQVVSDLLRWNASRIRDEALKTGNAEVHKTADSMWRIYDAVNRTGELA